MQWGRCTGFGALLTLGLIAVIGVRAGRKVTSARDFAIGGGKSTRRDGRRRSDRHAGGRFINGRNLAAGV